MKKICFIFAREGSTRLKNKNLKLLNHKPLIFYSINLAKRSKLFSDIYVSSDSKKILEYAKKQNVKTIERPKFLAGKNSKEFLAWKHAVKYLKLKKVKFDIFVSLPSTSPLRKIKDIQNCINKIKKKNQLATTFYYSDFYDNIKILKSKNKIKFISSKTIFEKRKRLGVLNGMVYVTTPKYILKYKDLFGGQLLLEEIPKLISIEINSAEDLNIVKSLIKKNKK